MDEKQRRPFPVPASRPSFAVSGFRLAVIESQFT
jgi:hypothetical protein